MAAASALEDADLGSRERSGKHAIVGAAFIGTPGSRPGGRNPKALPSGWKPLTVFRQLHQFRHELEAQTHMRRMLDVDKTRQHRAMYLVAVLLLVEPPAFLVRDHADNFSRIDTLTVLTGDGAGQAPERTAKE